MKKLGELFNENLSDKESSHHYAQYYEKHLPEKVNKLMEIGCWKAAGIKSFKEYYSSEGEFHVMDYIFGGEITSIAELKIMNVIPHRGSLDDIGFLKSLKEIFTVIIDDGSHHSDSQIISFKQLFTNNLESEGLYIIEDVYGHLPDPEGNYWRRGNVNTAGDTIMGVVNKFLAGGDLVSQFFSKEESDLIIPLIKEINIYDDKIIFISKKLL